MKLRIAVFFVLLAAGLCVGATALAAPPCPGERTVKQPSGEKITVTMHGNEWLSWAESSDGTVLVQGDDGYWRYAVYRNGGFQALNARYGVDAGPEGASDTESLQKAIGLDPPMVRQTEQKGVFVGQAEEFPKASGPQKLVVLLVSFSNIQIKESYPYWEDKIFGIKSPGMKTDANSSVNDYYMEVSNNRFFFLPAEEENGNPSDGIVNVKLDYDHPNYPLSNYALISNEVASDALVEASEAIDFSGFDTDEDGTVSPNELHIVMILAGTDQAYLFESANSVWSHSYGLQGGGIQLDGVYVGSDYSQLGEMHGSHPATIGVIAHELGHSLGLPDLDDYTKQSMGLGPYSLMASGAWGCNTGYSLGSSPAHLDAWCKTLLGFVEPEACSSGTVDLYSMDTGDYNVVMLTTQDPKQYFLLENRSAHGYDHSLSSKMTPEGGILCYHVDTAVAETNDWMNINNDYRHKTVDIEEANEGILRYSQMDTRDSRPLDSLFRLGSTSCLSCFGDTTTPSSRTYDGRSTGVYFSVESAIGPIMTVFLGGVFLQPDIAAPQLEGRTIRWTCSAGGNAASTYRFDVYRDGVLTGEGTSGYTMTDSFDWKPAGYGVYTIKMCMLVNGTSTTPITAESGPYEIIENKYSPVIAASAGGRPLSSGKFTALDVAVNLSDADADDVVIARYTLNGGSPASPWPDGGVFKAEGDYTVYASDLLGNGASFRFVIDRTAPVVTGRLANGASAVSGRYTNSAVTVTVADSYLLSKKATRNGLSVSWPSGGVFVRDGTYRVSGVDKAGNTASIAFTIDTAKPVVSARAYSGAAVRNGDMAARCAFVKVSDGNLLSVTARMGARTVAWPRGGRFTAVGSYTVTATDKAGNVAVFKFTIR